MNIESLLFALLLGAFGQAIRALLGIKKWIEFGRAEAFNIPLLGISLALGGVAGLVAAIIPGAGPVAIVAAGYAGSDALEGLLGRYMPKPA